MRSRALDRPGLCRKWAKPSVAGAALEPNEPMDAVPVDDLSIGVSPRPNLESSTTWPPSESLANQPLSVVGEAAT